MSTNECTNATTFTFTFTSSPLPLVLIVVASLHFSKSHLAKTPSKKSPKSTKTTIIATIKLKNHPPPSAPPTHHQKNKAGYNSRVLPYVTKLAVKYSGGGELLSHFISTALSLL